MIRFERVGNSIIREKRLAYFAKVPARVGFPRVGQCSRGPLPRDATHVGCVARVAHVGHAGDSFFFFLGN